ncbi:GNAT family N-acetyltransferase [Desulfolithobacter dissulfuricans]|nr:N-acetyltransferase [Desulfolithobacter dissulfuricans]
MRNIRTFREEDWTSVWPMLRQVFRAGETYALPPDISEQQARRVWIDVPVETFVMTGSGGEILGTYYLKVNHPGPGSHVCNCGYVVAAEARGQGVGRALGSHSLREAKERGFRAMQFNLVVSTNVVALRLWKKLGFRTIGTVPGAFNSPKYGYVDAFVMYRELT